MVSFKVLAVFAALLLAVAGPALARVYVLDDGMQADASNSTETTSTTTQLPTTLPPESGTDELPPLTQEPITDPPDRDEIQRRIDPGGEEEASDRSDREQDFTWTPVALVNSATTPFEVFKQPEAGDKSPKRTGFRNLRTNRGSFRHSNSVITQRPPPKAANRARPPRTKAYPPAHETLPLEQPPASSAPPPSPAFTQPDLSADYSAPVPAVVEHQDEDDDAPHSNERSPGHSEKLQEAEDWREARVLNQYAREPHSPDKVISANGEVIQLIPFTLEDTVPRTTPTYFPHPAFNDQLNDSENSKDDDEEAYGKAQSTPAPPSFEGPRKESSFSARATKNNTNSRNKDLKANTRPNFISKFNNDLSQDAGISGTRNLREFKEFANHPNGAFSRQIINWGNQTILEVLPLPPGRQEGPTVQNTTNQDVFDSSRNHRQFGGGQSNTLGHRPAVGFDRYRVPVAAVRPKVGYSVRGRHPANGVHHHHHAHDSLMSPSISVGRYALPPNTVIHGKPKGNGHLHRGHPMNSNLQYGNPQLSNPSPHPHSHLNSPHANPSHPNSPHSNSANPNSPHPNSPHSNSPNANSPHPNSPHPNSPHPNSPQPNLPHSNPPLPSASSQHPNGAHAPHSGPPHSHSPHNNAPHPNLAPQSGNASVNGGRYGPQQPYLKPDYRPGNLPHPVPLSELKRPLGVHDHLPGASHKFPGRYASPYGKQRPQGPRPLAHAGEDGAHGLPPPHRKPLYAHEDARGAVPPPQGRYPGQGGKGGQGGLSGPSGQAGHGPSGLGPERYAPQAQTVHQQKFAYSEQGKLPPPPPRGQYPGAHDDAYASAAINRERYAPPTAGKYKGPVPAYSAGGYDKAPPPVHDNSAPSGYAKPPASGYDNAAAASYNAPGPHNQQLSPQQGQNPNTHPAPSHTFQFPSNPSSQRVKPTPTGNRPTDEVRHSEEYEEDYRAPHNHNVKPTTIRPTGYKNPNLNNGGFSITEITQPTNPEAANARRPGSDDPSKPRHYGFPRLSTTARTPAAEDASQPASGASGAYKDSPGYAVYEEENYPTSQTTARPRLNKFSPSAPSPHRGKSSYAAGGAASTSRPRYKPRRPGGARGGDAQPEASSATAAYGPPAAPFAGDAGESVFTFAKTDYNGNVKWGVSHEVSMQGGGDGGGDAYGH